MSKEDIENQDSTNTEDEAVTNEDNDTDESVDIDSLKETNKKLYARLKKAEEELKAKKVQKEEEPKAEETSTPTVHIERLELKVDGYSNEEIDEIMKLGGKKALDNKIVKKAIDEMKEQRIAEQAQVEGTSATSDFSRKYSRADLEKMSAEELEKILPRS